MPVVVSVPHSGTRSQLRHLWNTCSGPEKETGPWHIYHFGEHDEDINSYVGPVDIPIRNPVDVMISWLNRGRPLPELFKAMELMATYRNPLMTVHRVEDVPVIIGHVPSELGMLHRPTLSNILSNCVSDEVLKFYKTRGGY